MDTQQLARNQLDGVLRAAASISGINYEQRIKELEQENGALVAALERAEQTIRNLGNAALTGDAKQIALNEAANLRADIAKVKEE